MTMALGLPRHMRSPGDDGYRTPTIEDAERDLSMHGDTNHYFSPARRKPRDVHTSALEALHSPSYRIADGTTTVKNEADAKEEHDVGVANVRCRYSETPPVNLSWKKRIRHFTWAYFTLTMATGGIANVLHTSNSFAQCCCPHTDKH